VWARCIWRRAEGTRRRRNGCDNEVIPLQVFDSERHLLYVACTRARDQVAVTAVAPGSEFLADLIEDDRA